jgi:hypothetical protein
VFEWLAETGGVQFGSFEMSNGKIMFSETLIQRDLSKGNILHSFPYQQEGRSGDFSRTG